MPTHVSLMSIKERRGSPERVASGDLLPLLAFSLIGVVIDSLAAFGAYGRPAAGFARLLLIVAAPVFAAIAAVHIAHPRSTDRRG